MDVFILVGRIMHFLFDFLSVLCLSAEQHLYNSDNEVKNDNI